MRNNNNHNMTTITTSITEQKKIEFKNSHTKKSNNNKMPTTMTVSSKDIVWHVLRRPNSNNNNMTQTITLGSSRQAEIYLLLNKDTTSDEAVKLNVTTISQDELRLYKETSKAKPLYMDQIMNYPHIHSTQGWMCVPDSTLRQFNRDLNKLPIDKRHKFKDCIITGKGSHTKVRWDAKEERFTNWQNGEWWFVCDCEEFCYNTKLLIDKGWTIKSKYIKLYNDYVADELALHYKVEDTIIKNRTGNADGRARKVKTTKKVNVYKA
tara:strand:- start:460 stop:1254 length:795 start_codon:yes stop_codon:yes gene_type:complete